MWISMLGATRPNEMFALFGRSVGVDRLYIENALDRHRNFKDTKTEKPREVFLPPILRGELQEWIRTNDIGPDDLLFQTSTGTPLSRQNVLNRRIRAAAKRAGIKTLDVDFRMMRRSFTTAFIALGGDVKSAQAQLGHARPDTTLLEYAQEVDPHRAALLEKAELIMRGRLPWPEKAYAKLMAKQGAIK